MKNWVVHGTKDKRQKDTSNCAKRTTRTAYENIKRTILISPYNVSFMGLYMATSATYQSSEKRLQFPILLSFIFEPYYSVKYSFLISLSINTMKVFVCVE